MSAERGEQWADRMAEVLEGMPRTHRRALERVAEVEQRTARVAVSRVTGRMRRSVTARVARRARLDTVVLASDHPGAEVQNRGGTVRPERAHRLAVPIGAARQVRGGPEQDGKLFWLRASNGREYLMRDNGGGSLTPRWRLMREVRVPGQRFLDRGLQAGADAYPSTVLDALERDAIGRR